MKKQEIDFEKMAVSAFSSAFMMTEDKMTREARVLINVGIPTVLYDRAFSISEGNRQDTTAVLIRYVFRAIEVNPDMNWFTDMRKMRNKLIQVNWVEFIRLYDIYRHKNKQLCPCQDLPLFPCEERSFA
ncbi:MAG: hypothetical protein V4714_17655 [Bacteroidota bacterium]